MARPKLTERPVDLRISLPESLAGRLTLDLFSEAEGRVPHGAYKRFFTKLLQDHYERLDALSRDLKAMNQHNNDVHPQS